MSSKRQQERVPFSRTHFSSIETLSTKQAFVEYLDTSNIKVDTLQRVDGSLFLDASSRLLNETASQPAPAAGEGRIWIRSADSKVIFTDDTNTDTDLTLVDTENVLLRGNDANAQTMQNLSSLTFATAVEFGVVGNTATSSQYQQVVIGKSASPGGSLKDVLIGTSTASAKNEDVLVGAGSSSFSAGTSTYAGGTAVGSNSEISGDAVAIGYNTVMRAGNMNNGIGVAIGSYISTNSDPLATTRCVSIGHDQSVGTNSVLIGNVRPYADARTDRSEMVLIGPTYDTSPSGDNNKSTIIGSYCVIKVPQSTIVGRYVYALTGSAPTVLSPFFSNTTFTASNILSNGTAPVAVGGYAAAGPYSIAIGYQATANSTNCIALQGYVGNENTIVCNANTTRQEDRFIVNSHNIIEYRSTLTTADEGPTTLMVFDFTPYDLRTLSFSIDASVLGRNNGNGSGTLNDTHFVSLKHYHFRNTAGDIAFITDVEENVTDNPDPDFLEQFVVTTGAFATNTQGEHFFIYDGNDDGADPEKGYFVWNDTAGDSTTGSPASLLDPRFNAIPVNTSGVTDDIDVAFQIATAINGQVEFAATGPLQNVVEIDFAGSFRQLQGPGGTPDNATVQLIVFGVDTTPGVNFSLFDANDANAYLVWNDYIGDDTTGKPALGSHDAYIRVNTSAAATTNDVATALRSAIGGLAAFTTSGINANVGITYTSTGFSSQVIQNTWSDVTVINLKTGSPKRGQYFFLNSGSDVTDYYVWFDTTGADPAPSPAPTANAIAVDVSATASDSGVASALSSVLGANFSGSVSTSVLTVTNTKAGVTTAPTNGDAYDPFTPAAGGPMISISFNTTVAGTNGNGASNKVIITNATSSVPGVARSINNTTAPLTPWQNVSVQPTNSFGATMSLIGQTGIFTANFTGAQFASTNGEYFLLGASSTLTYYVWNNVTGAGTGDPNPTGYTALPVDLSAVSPDTDGGYAQTVANAINANANFSVTGPVAGVSSIDLSGGVFANLVTGASSSTYFTLFSANNETGYYVWFANGTSVDPAPGGLFTTGIQCNFTPLSLGVTDDETLAGEIVAKLSALADFSASKLVDVVTVTNANGGTTTNVANTGSVTNLSVATTTAGNNTITITSASSISANAIDNTTNTDDPWSSVSVATVQSGYNGAAIQVFQRDLYEIDWVGVMRISTLENSGG